MHEYPVGPSEHNLNVIANIRFKLSTDDPQDLKGPYFNQVKEWAALQTIEYMNQQFSNDGIPKIDAVADWLDSPWHRIASFLDLEDVYGAPNGLTPETVKFLKGLEAELNWS